MVDGHETATGAHRQDLGDGITLWSGYANNSSVHWHTRDTVSLYVRPLFTEKVFGVELVDENGEVVAQSYQAHLRPLGPLAYEA